MKKIFALLMVLAACVMVWSCEKETVMTIDQSSLSFSDADGSQTISLSANKAWSASSNQSWCKVSPSAGEEAASSRITISCDANTTYDARSCTVTFTCAEMTKTVSISQATNNGLLVSQTSYELTKAAQQLNIQVQANVKFSVEVDNGCKDWVKYSTTKGLTTNTVVLDIAENKTYDGREGKVTIKQVGGSLSSTVTIKQSQLDGLFLTTSEYNLSNDKHTLTVEVSTNVEFDVKPEADWVKYVQTKGLSTKQIVLEVAENDTYDQRETKVNVKQKNGDLSGVITIKQGEKYGILVSQPEFDLSNEAATIDVEVKYNVDFEVVIPDDCKSWIKQVSTKSLNSKTYTFSIARNETYDNREGSITFKQKKGSLSGTVAIKQAQTDYLEVAKNEFTVDIEGETITIEVSSNVDYTVSISEDAQSWLSKVGTKGLSKDNLQIAVAAGNDNTDRKGEIIISFGDLKRTIKVHQYSFADKTLIQFADENLKERLVGAFDRNGDNELSIKEAQSVRTDEFFEVISKLKTIHSFDEFRFFTGIILIPEGAFKNCTFLESIILPDSIIDIFEYAFQNCARLKKILIPKTVFAIRGKAFDNCISLKSVVFEKGSSLSTLYTSDNYGPFTNCTSLEEIRLPASLTGLGTRSFYNCTSLKKIVFEEGSSLTEISGGPFKGCTGLEEIVLPEGILSFGYGAFEGCINLKSINISDKVQAYGPRSFYGCESLPNIPITNNCTFIGEEAFRYCCSIKSVYIPEDFTDIGYATFAGCSSLESISLPYAISEIPKAAFMGCSSLKQIELPENLLIIGDYAFNSCSSLKELEVPEGVFSIGKEAFAGSGLEYIKLPDNLTVLQLRTFHACEKLARVIIPSALVEIEDSVFENSGIESIILPEALTKIGYKAFRGCTKLKSIKLPNSLTELLTVFENCYSLESIEIPSQIKELMSNSFKGCSSLKSIKLPDNMEYIGTCSFLNCKNLTEIELPLALKSISSQCFQGCTNLQTVLIKDNVTEIQSGVFGGCDCLTTLTIPKSVTEISAHFAWNTLAELHLRSTIPPVITPYSTSSYSTSSSLWLPQGCIIYVPSSSLEMYKSAEHWSAYAEYIYPE